LSLVAADVTLVAAAETVRGVTAEVLLAAVLPAAVLPAVVLLLAVLLLPAVLLAAGRVVRVLLVTVAGLPAAVRVAGLVAASVVPGIEAVVFVGTDLPLDMDQLRGRHSTESNLLHLTSRKNNGGAPISVTLGHLSPPCGRSRATIRNASSGDAPRPTATPIR